MIELLKELIKGLDGKTAAALIVAALAFAGLFTVVTSLITFNKSNYIAMSKDFRAHELKVVFDVAETLPLLAYANSEDDWKKAVVKFWIFYSGPLVLVESKPVCTAMVRLGNTLRRTPPLTFADRGQLAGAVLAVSEALRSHLMKLQETDYSMGLDRIFTKQADQIECLS